SLLAVRGNQRFLNLGVPGTCLGQQLDIIRARHWELGCPRVYVFNFFLGNDYSDLIAYYHDKEDGEAQPETSKSARVLWGVNGFVYHNFILKHSFMLQL